MPITVPGVYRDTGLLLLRVGLGIAYIFHGVPKLVGGPHEWAQLGSILPLPVPAFWGFMAAIVETFGGVLLAVGLFFPLVCTLLLVDMMVALYFHLGPMAGNPIMGAYATGWSHPLKMAIVFSSLIFIGPGRYSMDSRARTHLPPL